MTTKRALVAALLGLAFIFVAMPGFAKTGKTVMTNPVVTKDVHHDTGPLLREVAPLLPEHNIMPFHEIENNEDPRFKEWLTRPHPADPVVQRPENSPTVQTPPPNVTFDALGFGDNFFCDCMPADNDGAPGTTQYVEFINTEYAVYSKTGTRELGPLAGSSFWSGFGGGCEADNWGDPTIRFDAAAKRWVAAQFDLGPSGGGPYAECVAVSTTDDATGSYNRYRFTFGQFPDYPKMGVWPDGYYFSYNINGSTEEVCANDRTAMLSGASATQVCFNPRGQFGMLPADLDGATPPASGTPNFFMELGRSGGASLNMYAFHVDFVTPSNSTFTGPTTINVPSFTPACPGASRGACAPQPDAGSDPLETLSDRLMYRLVYRNFGDHSVLLAAHAVQVNGTGSGARWYEIRNPESGTPTVFQSGTFAPDSQYRFMPAVAMDQSGDIAVGYTRSGSGAGQFPSLVYAGRVPSDPAGTLETEVTMLAGTGSQSSGGFSRWGDYSSMTVDPADDCTFWFSESYVKTTGQNQGFNWSTGIGSFTFPTCGGGGTPDFSLSANPTSVTIAAGNQGTSTITVNPIDGFNSNVTLSAAGQPSGVTANFNPNPTSTTSLLTLTVPAGTATGTSTVTITGTSGSLTHTTTVQLTITGGGGGPVVTLSPTSLTFANTVTGKTSAAKTVTMTNTGTATLNITSIVASGDFAISSNACGSTLAVSKSCKFKVTFTPTQLGTRTGAVTITDNASNSPQTVALTGTGTPQATLTPAKANFAKTAVGGTSAAKTFTLKNKGTASLTGISPSTTGDFAISTTTCGSSLAGNGSCTISVVFKPTQTGLRSGSLQVSDSAVGSPQVSTLTGTGK